MRQSHGAENTLGDSLLGLWLGPNLGLDPSPGLDPVTAPLKQAKSCDSAMVLTNTLGDKASVLCAVDVLFKLFTA